MPLQGEYIDFKTSIQHYSRNDYISFENNELLYEEAKIISNKK